MQALVWLLGVVVMALPSRLVAEAPGAFAWAGPALPWELAVGVFAAALVPAAPRKPVCLARVLPFVLVAVLAATLVVPPLAASLLRAVSLALWVSLALPEAQASPADTSSRAAAVSAALWLLAGLAWFGSAHLLLFGALQSQIGLSAASSSWALPWVAALWGTEPSFREHRLLTGAPLAGALLASCLIRLAGTFAIAPQLPAPAAHILSSVPAVLSLAALIVMWARPQPEIPAQESEPAASPNQLTSPFALLEGSERLSPQEALALERSLAQGTLREIAREMGVAPSTAGTYRARALHKLGVSSLQELSQSMREALAQDARPSAPKSPASSAFATHTQEMPRSQIVALVLGGVAFGLAVAVALACPAIYRGPCALAVLAEVTAAWALLVRGSASRRGAARVLLASCGVVLVALAPPGATLVGMSRAPLALMASSCVLLAGAYLLVRRAQARRARAAADVIAGGEARVISYLEGRGMGKVQAQALLLIASDLATKSIAAALFVAPSTVSNYRTKGYAALGIHSKKELCELLEREAGFTRRAPREAE